jgi:hypothetical protein
MVWKGSIPGEQHPAWWLQEHWPNSFSKRSLPLANHRQGSEDQRSGKTAESLRWSSLAPSSISSLWDARAKVDEYCVSRLALQALLLCASSQGVKRMASNSFMVCLGTGDCVFGNRSAFAPQTSEEQPNHRHLDQRFYTDAKTFIDGIPIVV